MVIYLLYYSIHDLLNSTILKYRGDTVSRICKKEDKKMKLDLRVLCTAFNDTNEQDDVSSGEFAKNATNLKYYKDKMKLIIHGKMLLNEVIKNLGKDSHDIKEFRICMLQAMGNIHTKFDLIFFFILTRFNFYDIGLEAELFSLRLFANGLYILESHGYLNIPTTICSYAESMNLLLSKLSIFKVII
jgi:hypothetical protein